ncbi:MAG: helix-turn-helix domain-containing protein [Xanthobacteraceae bacterium]|nr:helix-turn-helix domain-containing protein [Xanthobacteraceae bacterium]
MEMDSKIVKSAGRVLAILEFFDEIMRPAGAAEVRAHIGLPASSTSALLGSLARLGYLHYDTRSRLYCPTLRVGLLGDWVQNGGAMRSLLEDLNRQTGQLVVLGARCQLSAQYIQVVRASHSRPVRRGTLAPLTRTAVGWVLMSKLNDNEIIRLVTRVNADEAPDRRVLPSQLLERIHAVRGDGYAYCFGQVTPGVGAIGMPLPATADEPPVVLAVSGSGSGFVEQRDDIVAMMRERVDRYGKARHAANG